MSDFDDRPPLFGVAVAALLGTVALLASLAGHPAGIALVAAAVGVLVAGTVLGSRRLPIAGVGLAWVGFLLQAVLGAGPVAPLVGGAAAVVAWDVADHAIGLGEQVGRAARSRHAVLAHAAFGSVVAGAVVAVGVALFRIAPGDRPFGALLFLLLATLLIPIALGD